MSVTSITFIKVQIAFTNFGSNAVEKYFTQEEIEELMELTKKLAA